MSATIFPFPVVCISKMLEGFHFPFIPKCITQIATICVFCKRFLEKSAKLFGEYCISKMEKSADRLKTLIADILVRTNSPSVDMFVRTVDGYI